MYTNIIITHFNNKILFLKIHSIVTDQTAHYKIKKIVLLHHKKHKNKNDSTRNTKLIDTIN